MNNHSHNYKYGYVEIIKIERKKFASILYNFAVEDDASYIAKGFISKNCRCSLIALKKGKKRRGADTVCYPNNIQEVVRPKRKPKLPKIPIAPIASLDEVSNYLMNGDIINAKKIRTGVTNAYIVKYKNNTRGIFKPIILSNGYDMPEHIAAEVGAYNFTSKILNWDLVPVTVKREKDVSVFLYKRKENLKGSIQKWKEKVFTVDKALNVKKIEKHEIMKMKNAEEMALFDLMSNNKDRHIGNFLVDIKNKKLIAIDNGLSFQNNSFSIDTLDFYKEVEKSYDKLNSKLINQIEKLNLKRVEKVLLDSGISKKAAEKAKMRIGAIKIFRTSKLRKKYKGFKDDYNGLKRWVHVSEYDDDIIKEINKL